MGSEDDLDGLKKSLLFLPGLEPRTLQPIAYTTEYAAEYLACILFLPLYSVFSVRMTILQHQENKAIYLS